jgi:glycosyltransferase involved in cell wall biosynthesis
MTLPEPTFTIVVPAYNAARTIQSAIRSALAQTREDFELVVVDDGSQDDTGERAREFEDPRIVIVRQENAGVAAASNAGLDHARGRYISRLDADDLYLPTYLEAMERTLAAAPDAGYAYTDGWILDDKSRRIRRATAMASERPPIPPPTTPADFLAELLERNFVFGLAMMRRSALDHVGPFNTSIPQAPDYEMWLRMAAHGYRGVRAPGTLAVYRRRYGTLSANLLGTAIAQREIYRLVGSEYDMPDWARQIACRRTAESDARVQAARAALARRRLLPTPLRRLLGRGYRTLRSRGTWYDVPPPEVAAAFPDLRTV